MNISDQFKKDFGIFYKNLIQNLYSIDDMSDEIYDLLYDYGHLIFGDGFQQTGLPFEYLDEEQILVDGFDNIYFHKDSIVLQYSIHEQLSLTP